MQRGHFAPEIDRDSEFHPFLNHALIPIGRRLMPLAADGTANHSSLVRHASFFSRKPSAQTHSDDSSDFTLSQLFVFAWFSAWL